MLLFCRSEVGCISDCSCVLCRKYIKWICNGEALSFHLSMYFSTESSWCVVMKFRSEILDNGTRRKEYFMSLCSVISVLFINFFNNRMFVALCSMVSILLINFPLVYYISNKWTSVPVRYAESWSVNFGLCFSWNTAFSGCKIIFHYYWY